MPTPCSPRSSHEPGPTYDTLGKGGSLEGGQAQVTNLDRARGARDEDVVTLEVAVDDGGRASVQEMQTLEDLPAPALQHLQLHLFKPLQIPAGDQQGSDLWGSGSCPALAPAHPPPVAMPSPSGLRCPHRASNKEHLGRDPVPSPARPNHVFRVPDVMSSVTSTMQIWPLIVDFQES